MTDAIKGISLGLEAAMIILQKDMRQELEDQGHVNTGRLRDSIEYTITEGVDKVTATIECEDYGLAIDLGVSASRVPYGGPGGGGTSQYIQGLITYFRSKGLQGREAIGAAFATANVHKREGIPSAGSYKFSKNGKRLGFATETLERDLEIIAKTLLDRTGSYIEFTFAEQFNMEPITIYA